MKKFWIDYSASVVIEAEDEDDIDLDYEIAIIIDKRIFKNIFVFFNKFIYIYGKFPFFW